jgi:signal transduction histidine kinase
MKAAEAPIGVGAPAANFRLRYSATLRRYLASQREEALELAHELGREALASNMGLLDMVGVHFEAASAVLRERSRSLADMQQLFAATGRFLVESVAPFETSELRSPQANASLLYMDLLEQESRRIARMVHDQAGQLLAMAYLELAELSEQGAERARRITGYLDRLREQLRQLSHEVHPHILEELGLLPALRLLVEGIAKRCRLAASVQGFATGNLSPALRTAVYRVAQEALVNVARHAQAKHVSVFLWRERERLHCLVRDDGRGFDVASARGGLGIIGMRERVKALHGIFELDSARGRGTTVHVSLPVHKG